MKDAAFERNDRCDDAAEWLPDPPRRMSFSRLAGPDHSLSVAGELTDSSKSPTLLPPPPLLVEADPETRLRVEELALISFSFSFSFSSKSMNILDRASL